MRERILQVLYKLQEIYELTGLHIETTTCYETLLLDGKEIIGNFIFDTETSRYCLIIRENGDEIELFA